MSGALGSAVRAGLAALIALLSPGIAVAAQAPATLAPRLTLFADRFFRGPTIVFAVDEGDIRPEFAPRSLQVRGRWQLCSEPRFRGRCVEVDHDFPIDTGIGLDFNIRSLRVLRPGSGAGRPVPGVTPGGASMAGMAARFFPAPLYGGERVLACPAGNDEKPGDDRGSADKGCAKDTAEALCRRAGYTGAEHFALQPERGLYYLADVLCVSD